MQTQTNTVELTQVELTNLSGGDGYAPSNSTQGSSPQQAAEELIKLTTGAVYY